MTAPKPASKKAPSSARGMKRADEADVPAAALFDQGRWRRVGERSALIVCWAAIVALFGIWRPDQFLTVSNMGSIFGSQAVLLVLTIGLLPVLKAGDYDLSVASLLTLSAMLVAVLNGEHHMSLALVLGIALLVGLLVGAINAAFSVLFGVDSFIVTLGVGTFLQGIVLWISGSQTLSGVSNSLVNSVIASRFLGIPIEFYYGVGVTLLMWYVFEHTVTGRRLLFVGRAREVARLSGISVDRVRTMSFLVTGLLSAGAGVLYAGSTGGADPTSGLTFLLPAYAAAYLGATAIVPGEFNAWGAFVAVYFLVTGISGLAIVGVETYVSNLFYGASLVIAVTLSRLSRRRGLSSAESV